MNLWNEIVLTRTHYQMGALSRQGYIEMLGIYYAAAVKLQLEGK